MDQIDVAAMLRCQRLFVAERKWRQFHTPKNLAMALCGEAAELLELFQWLTPAESRRIMRASDKARAVANEMADVWSYLLRLADILGVDIEKAFWDKMKENRAKYPAGQARGNARKYNELLKSKGLHPRRRS